MTSNIDVVMHLSNIRQCLGHYAGEMTTDWLDFSIHIIATWYVKHAKMPLSMWNALDTVISGFEMIFSFERLEFSIK